jgi:hypothetical protein
MLIETKTYQTYIVERIIKEITDPKVSSILRYNLIQILMQKSEVPIVREELIKILNSKNENLKQILFEYNVVMPVADIVFSKEFRFEIVKYINSDKFISSYDGRFPTQYSCAFENVKKSSFKSYLEIKSNTEYLKEQLLSIRLIENEKMRLDFINYNVFSIGMSNIDQLKEFTDSLKDEYQGIQLPRIENRIKELEEFKSYDLNEYEVVKFKSTKIFVKKDKSENFAFIKDNKVEFIRFPFNHDNLQKYFFDETRSYIKFLNLLIPNILNPKNKFSITNLETLLNFIKFQDTIHWHTDIDTGNLLNFALTNLFSSQHTKALIHWIKEEKNIKYKRFELSEDFNKQKFFSEVLASNLHLFEKLYLLHLTGEKSDYEHLLIPTIESIKKTKSQKKKNEIRKVLYDVL